jgi:hypothetical protein
VRMCVYFDNIHKHISCVSFLTHMRRTVMVCVRKSDGHHVIVKSIPVDDMTKDERAAALNEVKVCECAVGFDCIGYNRAQFT